MGKFIVALRVDMQCGIVTLAGLKFLGPGGVFESHLKWEAFGAYPDPFMQ